MSNPPAFELVGAHYRVGTFQLGPLNFSVPQGEVLGLIGPNGAGKTTLLNLLLGLGWPDSGTIRVLGLDIPHDLPKIRLRTAYVHPDLSYSAWGTIGSALDFLRRFYPDWDNDRCERLLADFHLSRSSEISDLSSGTRIRFLLVAAFTRDPDLIILDEPTMGLDIVARRRLFAEIGRTRQRDTCTIVLASHQLSDIERIADSVAIMNKGQILAYGGLETVLEDYIQVDVELTSNAIVPPINGLRMMNFSRDRARILFPRTPNWRQDLDASGYKLVVESKMSLEDLAAALTGS